MQESGLICNRTYVLQRRMPVLEEHFVIVTRDCPGPWQYFEYFLTI